MADFETARADFVPLSLRDIKLEKSDVSWADIGGKARPVLSVLAAQSFGRFAWNSTYPPWNSRVAHKVWAYIRPIPAAAPFRVRTAGAVSVDCHNLLWTDFFFLVIPGVGKHSSLRPSRKSVVSTLLASRVQKSWTSTLVLAKKLWGIQWLESGILFTDHLNTGERYLWTR